MDDHSANARVKVEAWGNRHKPNAMYAMFRAMYAAFVAGGSGQRLPLRELLEGDEAADAVEGAGLAEDEDFYRFADIRTSFGSVCRRSMVSGYWATSSTKVAASGLA